MPIHTNWLIENKVIYSFGWGEITEQELTNFAETTEQLANSANMDVHLIQNTHLVTKPYINVVVAIRIFWFMRNLKGWLVQIGEPPSQNTIEIITNMIARTVGINRRTNMSDYDTVRDFFAELEPPLILPEDLPKEFLVSNYEEARC